VLVELGERMKDEPAVDLLDVRGLCALWLNGYGCLLWWRLRGRRGWMGT
jgi:hypothetical protein